MHTEYTTNSTGYDISYLWQNLLYKFSGKNLFVEKEESKTRCTIMLGIKYYQREYINQM